MSKKYKITNIGIAIPGTVNKTSVIKSVNLNLENYNIVEALKKKINIPIKIKNDAKCAALALVFGLVAGGVMTGVNYASGKVLGTTNAGNVQASLTTGDDSTVQPTAISSSYVATDVSDIVDEVMPSIVAITNVSQTEYQSFWGQSKTYESTSCGSGIIVSQDKEYLYVATNNHAGRFIQNQ